MDEQAWLLVEDCAKSLEIEFFDYQRDTFEEAWQILGTTWERLCLYYKTGAGKSITALVCMKIWGHDKVLVITPPSTYDQWIAVGEKLGVEVECMSHAKYRMKNTKVKKDVPIIADEFHLFGGHGGKGWKKFDTMARHLKAPIIIASATPNYNDADRVYCIQHVMDPHSCKGGFIEFLYAHCETEQDPFSTTPKVTGFRNYVDAAAYLAALPGVMYLPDDLVYTIIDTPLSKKIPQIMAEFGANPRKAKMIGSIIERTHAEVDLTLINDMGYPSKALEVWLSNRINAASGPVIVYADHSTVAEAIYRSLSRGNGPEVQIVTGDTTQKNKSAIIQAFRDRKIQVLIGTASLATGTDGLDRVCNHMFIADDTNDPSLRRQLVGRIMPRGGVGDVSDKHVHRLVLQ